MKYPYQKSQIGGGHISGREAVGEAALRIEIAIMKERIKLLEGALEWMVDLYRGAHPERGNHPLYLAAACLQQRD